MLRVVYDQYVGEAEAEAVFRVDLTTVGSGGPGHRRYNKPPRATVVATA